MLSQRWGLKGLRGEVVLGFSGWPKDWFVVVEKLDRLATGATSTTWATATFQAMEEIYNVDDCFSSDLEDGKRVSELCKETLGVETDEEEHWWETWDWRWEAFFHEWLEQDELTRTLAARKVRKHGKDNQIPKAEVSRRVDEALAMLPFQIPVDEVPVIPEVEFHVSPELQKLRRKQINEARNRLEKTKHLTRDHDMRESEAALFRATLADAKAKVLGRPVDHVKKLRLSVKDFRMLSTGTGIRRGITSLSGQLLEQLRQNEYYGQELSLRCRAVDDEWAAQIGVAVQLHLADLTALDLACNSIGTSGSRSLAQAIAASSTLTSLNLSNNPLDATALDLLADGLAVNTTLTELSLASLKFGEKLYEPGAAWQDTGHTSQDAENSNAEEQTMKQTSQMQDYVPGLGRMADLLIVASTLRKLDLAGNRMGAALFGQLCDSLSLNQSVTWLAVSGNCIGSDGGGYLGRLLATTSRLQYVDVSSNGIGPDGADYFSLQMDTNTSLTHLQLASNGLGKGGVTWLAQVLRNFQSLLSLDVSWNDLGEDFMSMQSNLVHQGSLTSLTSLKLNQNPIGDWGLKHMALSMYYTRNLRRLQLQNCEITDKGAAVLGAMVATMSSLRVLDVAFNRVTEIGAWLCSEWLLVKASRCRLREINLDGNLCGDSLVESLERLLERGPFIHRLYLRGNFLTVEGVQKLQHVVTRFPHVTEVKLDGNDYLTPEGIEAVKSMMTVLEQRRARRPEAGSEQAHLHDQAQFEQSQPKQAQPKPAQLEEVQFEEARRNATANSLPPDPSLLSP